MLFIYALNRLTQYNKRREQATGQVCTMYPHIPDESLDWHRNTVMDGSIDSAINSAILSWD
jgi:hypothetical protein